MPNVRSFSLITAALFVSSALAQETGSITGQVLDPTLAAVVGAQAAIRNEATGIAFTTLSDRSGFYRAPQLAPGVYSLTVSAAGFRTLVQESVIVRVNDRLRVDVKLEVGEVNERVTVKESPPLLQVEDAVMGQVVDNQKIVDLPLNGRNWLQLATLAAGTVSYPNVVNVEGGNRQNVLMNLGGNRTANTNYLLDGSDNNGWFVPGALAFPPVDSLREFKVETNNYTADAGRLGGAVVSASIKSGTNSFHGTAYDFLRNRKLNARNFFARPLAAKPQFTRNQFGASVGGPIRRDSLFVFFNYEGTRQRQNQVVTRQVFTAAEKAGDFSAQLRAQAGVDGAGQPVLAGQIYDPFSVRRLPSGAAIRDPIPANRIPVSRMNPVSKALIDLVPGPNTSGTPNFLRDLSDPLNIDTFVGRLDWTRGKDSVFGHFIYSDQHSDTAPVFGFPIDGGGQSLTSNQRQFAAAWTRVLSPANLNELRISYARKLRFTESLQNEEDLNGRFGIPFPFNGPGYGGLANMTIAGVTTIGSLCCRFPQYLNKYELADNFTMIRGAHTLKFGFQGMLKVFQNRGACNNCRGVLNFNGVFTQQPGFGNTGSATADFLFGTLNAATFDNVRNVSAVSRDYYLYIQDKWRVNSKLTVTLGLRYGHYPPTWVKAGSITSSVVFERGFRNPQIVTSPVDDARLAFFRDVLVPFVSVRRASDLGLSNGLVKDTPEDFGPRLGIAYRLSQKTVLRAGYGIFYGYPDQASVGLATNPPNFLAITETSNAVDPTFLLNRSVFGPNPFNRALTNPAWIGIRDPNFRYDLI